MARAISNSLKKIVFNSIPSTTTIDETDIAASKIWANQTVTSYPTIDLNISNDGIASDIRDIEDGVLYHKATLTIHILTENQDGFNGSRIAEQFAADICEEIESWTTPLTGDVRIFNPDSDINSIGNNGFEDGVFDYILSITIYHS